MVKQKPSRVQTVRRITQLTHAANFETAPRETRSVNFFRRSAMSQDGNTLQANRQLPNKKRDSKEDNYVEAGYLNLDTRRFHQGQQALRCTL
jgi:hypothetical protein